MKELVSRTLTDERQFKLTVRVMLAGVAALGWAVGFVMGLLAR